MTPRPFVVLRRGDSGPAVAAVMERLVLTGDFGPDELAAAAQGGYLFDARLEQAVRAFQQRRGLMADGMIGRSTYGVLDGARWQLGGRILQLIPDRQIEGDDVVDLQQRLSDLGFGPLKADGLFGVRTDRATRGFQASMGLVADGTVGPETMRTFNALRRSVRGGSAHALQERELLRRSGHNLAGRVVVLDPGHGPGDPGAVSEHGLAEAELVLDVARRIEGRLSANGVNVLFTRSEHTDAGTDEDRADFANAARADLVISLHCDHTAAGSAHGVATFFYGGTGPDADESKWSATGQRLSDLIQREVVARTGLTDCRIHARSWALLRRTQMPAVQVVIGYLSNPIDEQLLERTGTLDQIAEGVVVALQRMYLGEADMGNTGVLRLADLRKHLEEMQRTGGIPQGRPASD